MNYAAKMRTLLYKRTAMLPFHTTVRVDGHFAEYRITYEEDVYKAELVMYNAARPFTPSAVIFWKDDHHWVPMASAQAPLVNAIGSLIDIYLFKATTFKTS